MEDIFGKDVMEAFQKKRPAGYVDLMIAFESRKRGCSPNKLTPLNIALPFSFIDFYKRHKGKDVSRKFQKMNDKGKIKKDPNINKIYLNPRLVWL